MPDDKLGRTIYPRGMEGLLGSGPVAPGPGEVPPIKSTAEDEAGEAGEALEALGKALTPQMAVDVAARTARAEARGAVQGILAEERQRQEDEASRRKDRLRPFFGFMESLRNLSSVGPGGEGPDGRTELVLKLYRLETNGGPKPSKVFQTQVALSQEEALGLGDPDFEGRTMEWALQQGQFGRFEWRLLGWADGESILDTSYNVTVEQPAHYVPPVRPAVAAEPEVKPDPMNQFKETLTLFGMVRDTLGLKGGGGMDAVQIETIKAAASSQARLEAANEHRKELRDLEDRHRKELDEAEKKGYERGKSEGARALEAERLRWDLQKAQEAPEGPSFVQEMTAVLGGPQRVQSLVGGILAAVNQQRPAPAPRPGTGGNVKPLRPPVAMNPASAPQPEQAEPTRAEWHQAMEDLEEGLALLQEHLEGSELDQESREKVVQLIPLLEAYRDRGLQDGPLGAWWMEWPQVKAIVEPLIASEEEPHGEEDMMVDLESLKALLLQRLDEGATDEAILAELQVRVSAEILQQWRGMLRWIPASVVASTVGNGRHAKRLEGLLNIFTQ